MADFVPTLKQLELWAAARDRDAEKPYCSCPDADRTYAELESDYVRVVEELERERSSRQAWAEEALRLDVELKQERRISADYAEQARTHRCDVSDTQIDADTMTDIYPTRGVKATAYPDTSVPDLYDPDLDLARPQCTVHPEAQAWEQLPLFDIPQKEES